MGERARTARRLASNGSFSGHGPAPQNEPGRLPRLKGPLVGSLSRCRCAIRGCPPHSRVPSFLSSAVHRSVEHSRAPGCASIRAAVSACTASSSSGGNWRAGGRWAAGGGGEWRSLAAGHSPGLIARTVPRAPSSSAITVRAARAQPARSPCASLAPGRTEVTTRASRPLAGRANVLAAGILAVADGDRRQPAHDPGIVLLSAAA